MDSGGGSTTRAREAAPRSVAQLVERVRHRQPGDAHRVVGGLLLVAWLAWLVVTALMQPRLVSDARFREDVASGEVVAWRVVAMAQSDDMSWAEDLDLDWLSLGPDGLPADTDHRGVVTVAYATSLAPWTRVIDNSTDPMPPEYLTLLRASGVPSSTTYFDDPPLDRPGWAEWAGLSLGLLFFGALLLGPRPVHGTPWFWFWLAFPTLGLGVVVYTLAEHLRRPRDGLERHRRSGLTGLLFSIGLGVVTQMVLATLVATTGWVWLVRP